MIKTSPSICSFQVHSAADQLCIPTNVGFNEHGKKRNTMTDDRINGNHYITMNERQVFGNNFLSTEQIAKFKTEERK